MRKKILVLIGANGLIGRSFIDMYSKKYKIIKCLRKDDLSRVLEKYKPTIIFNSSGEPYDKKKMFFTNVLLVKKIIDYCIDNKSFLIHLGSSAEYGRHLMPTRENSELRPTTVYEGTKAAASMLIRGYAQNYNLQAVIIRPYCVFGNYSKPNLLIPMIIEAIQKNKFMKIYKGVHDFIYVKDFIRGIDKIIQKRNKCNSGEVINLGSGKQLSNFKVLNYVQKIFGNRKKSNFKIINKKYRSYDSDMWVGNIQHALKKYKFRCKYSFIEALRDMKKEYRINK
jgi:nucleoside-diphosphate-sugar epimerase